MMETKPQEPITHSRDKGTGEAPPEGWGYQEWVNLTDRERLESLFLEEELNDFVKNRASPRGKVKEALRI